MKKIIIVTIFIIVLFVFAAAFFAGGGKYAITYNRPSVSDPQELKDLIMREDEELSTYKLIDTTNGIYQIPIDSAMRIFIKENTK